MMLAQRWTYHTVLLASLLSVANCKPSAEEKCGAYCGCFTLEDCPQEQICFLGTCQAPGYNISSVYIDLYPPASSHLLSQADTGSPRDLSRGLKFDITMRRSQNLSGSIAADNDGRQSGVLKARAFFDEDSVHLPSSTTESQCRVESDGTFSLPLIAGDYVLTFDPSNSDAVKPPVNYSEVSTNEGQVELSYPDHDLWTTITGRILATAEDHAPIVGAKVSAIGKRSLGADLISTVATSDANGNFSLLFAYTPERYDVHIQPGTNPLVPDVVKSNLRPVRPPNNLGDLVLDVPASKSFSALITTPSGAPTHEVMVIFDGSLSGGGRFTSQAKPDDDGLLETTLLPGNYTITVNPARTLPYALSENAACIGTAECSVDAPAVLVLGNRITVTGRIVSHDGKPAAQARIVFTRQNVATPREFNSTADDRGYYRITIDPASGSDAMAAYEVVVEPNSEVIRKRHLPAQPHFRELLQVGTQNIAHNIRLYPASFVYGRALSPSHQPLADVSIALYSLELGSADAPLLVGLGKSNTDGEFVIPLPTPAVP